LKKKKQHTKKNKYIGLLVIGCAKRKHKLSYSWSFYTFMYTVCVLRLIANVFVILFDIFGPLVSFVYLRSTKKT